MEAIQKAIQKMGSNFIVASFVPAMGFIIFSFIVFLPIVPSLIRDYLQQIAENFIEKTIVILIFTTLIGFTLFTLSTFIYKSFEGYTFIFSKSTLLGKAGLKRQRKRIKQIEKKERRIKRALETIDERIGFMRKRKVESTYNYLQLVYYEAKRERLKEELYTQIAWYNSNFPNPALLLPTRFGNILRAAETYAGKRYGIDSVELWGRLAHVIPQEGMALVDNSNNECLFLLNSSLLATISSLLCLFSAVYQYSLSLLAPTQNQLLYFIPIDLEPIEYQQRAWIYLLLFIFSLMGAWFFYEASLLNVEQFGSMIRSSYDLYRFRLIEALHLKLPNNSRKEYQLWLKISNFFATGDEIDYKSDFTYIHRE